MEHSEKDAMEMEYFGPETDLKSEPEPERESFKIWRWEVTFPAGAYVSIKERFGLWLRCYSHDLVLLAGKACAAFAVLALVHFWGYSKGFDGFQERVDAGWYTKNATKWEEFERQLAEHPGGWAPRAWAHAGSQK